MKTFSLLVTLIIVISSNLSARENPFEPTQTYETEVARLMEIEEDYPYEFQEKEDQEEHKTQEKNIHSKTDAAKMPPPMMQDKNTSMPQVDKEAKKEIKPKMQMKPTSVKKMALVEPKITTAEPMIPPMPQEMPAKKEETKTITLENAMSNLSEEKIEVQVPNRKGFGEPKMEMIAKDIHENIDLLPFVNLDYTNDKITIGSKYEVFRKFTIDKSKKIVLDYHAKIFFSTKSKKTPTQYFEKVIAGNHLKERYFRIVVVLKDKPSKYKVTYTNNLVTIEFDKDMI